MCSSDLSVSSHPENFPAGTYTIATYLDTVSSECTSNPSTWTCSPGTIFDDDAYKSLAVFKFTITGSDSSYQIVSDDGTTVPPSSLEMIGKGTDNERYRFQIKQDKRVDTTIDDQAATCVFKNMFFRGDLYTKRALDYPLEGQHVEGNKWPFAVKFEQNVSGEETPTCYKRGSRDVLDVDITSVDATTMCSCLYRNWKTPSPYV